LSAVIGDIEFWALLIFVPIGAALLFMVVVRRTGQRAAELLDKALTHKDERNHP